MNLKPFESRQISLSVSFLYERLNIFTCFVDVSISVRLELMYSRWDLKKANCQTRQQRYLLDHLFLQCLFFVFVSSVETGWWGFLLYGFLFANGIGWSIGTAWFVLVLILLVELFMIVHWTLTACLSTIFLFNVEERASIFKFQLKRFSILSKPLFILIPSALGNCFVSTGLFTPPLF